MKPELYLKTLSDQWPVVSTLWASHESRTFSQGELYRVARDVGGAQQIAASAIAAKLVSCAILVENKRGGQGYSFNTHLVPFIQFLLDEQKLGLLAEITANTDTLRDHLDQIRIALFEGRRTGFFQKCQEMESRFHTLQRLVDQNTRAIYHLVDEAKQADRSQPIKERYAKVITAWDSYVRPALEMKSPGQPFTTLITQITREFQAWLEDATLSVLMADDARHQLESVHFRMLDFRELLDRSIDIMSRKLTPLIQQARINTQISQGASIAFRSLAKTGSIAGEHDLKLPAKVRLVRRADSNALLEFYSSFMDAVVTEEAESLPVGLKVEAAARKARRETVADMIHWIKTARPVDDICQTLKDQYPQATAQSICKALGALSRDPATRTYVMRHDDRQEYHFENLTVIMMRRSFNLASSHKIAPYTDVIDVLPQRKPKVAAHHG